MSGCCPAAVSGGLSTCLFAGRIAARGSRLAWSRPAARIASGWRATHGLSTGGCRPQSRLEARSAVCACLRPIPPPSLTGPRGRSGTGLGVGCSHCVGLRLPPARSYSSLPLGHRVAPQAHTEGRRYSRRATLAVSWAGDSEGLERDRQGSGSRRHGHERPEQTLSKQSGHGRAWAAVPNGRIAGLLLVTKLVHKVCSRLTSSYCTRICSGAVIRCCHESSPR